MLLTQPSVQKVTVEIKLGKPSGSRQIVVPGSIVKEFMVEEQGRGGHLIAALTEENSILESAERVTTCIFLYDSIV